MARRPGWRRRSQDRIEAELGLSASLGVAANKLVAKIASDFRKPHGITVVPPGQEAAFLAPLPIRRLWGVGEVTGRELARLGVQTIGDLARLSQEELQRRFGAHGEGLWRAVRGIDNSPVTPEHEAKSLSREETFAQDVRDPTLLRRELLRLSDAVAARLRRHNLQARTVALKLRYPDFTTLTRQATLADPTDAGPAIYAQALALFDAAWDRRPVRLIGVGAANLGQPARQLRLFEQADQRQAQLEAALDRIRARFGDGAIQRASLLEEPEALWVPKGVPEEARQAGWRVDRLSLQRSIQISRGLEPGDGVQECGQIAGLPSQQAQLSADGVGGRWADGVGAMECKVGLVNLAQQVAMIGKFFPARCHVSFGLCDFSFSQQLIHR